MAALIALISLSAFCLINALAAFKDLQAYRIPNSLMIALAAFYPFFALSHPHDPYIWISLGLAGLFFLIGLGLFSLNIMGGGDVKMICLVALWVGPTGIVPFVYGMAIVGAGMSLFMLLAPLRRTSARLCAQLGWHQASDKIMTDKLPYGVAIAAGGLTAMLPVFGLIL